MSQQDTRYPTWAGSFYPQAAEDLEHTINTLAPDHPASSKQLRGMIMPHAGYVYSGATASYAGADIKKMAPATIVLLGPDHHVGLSASHICQKKIWQTPLGEIPLSAKNKKLLQDHRHLFVDHPLSDRKEHSLEVILPFLQSWIESFELTPIVTGQVDPTELALAISPLIGEDALLIVSSDLSHFLPAQEAEEKDLATIDAILNMDKEGLSVNNNKACGLTAIMTLLVLAQQQKWTPHLLHYSHSGKTSGEMNRVVGYTTIGFYQEDKDVHQ